MPRDERIVHSYRCPALPSANGGADGRPYGPCSCGAIFTGRAIAGGAPWLARPHRVLLADPPWRSKDKLPGGRGAAAKYPTLATRQICAARCFPFPLMMDDSVLFLWRMSSMPQDALDVIAAWGFTVKSELVWTKRTKNGKRHFGMGRYVRNGHEVVHIATRGRCKPRTKSMRSEFDAPVPLHGVEYCGPDGEWCTDPPKHKHGRIIHSGKPHRLHEIIEEMYGGPRVELFSRRPRKGWLVVGNQVAIQEAA